MSAPANNNNSTTGSGGGGLSRVKHIILVLSGKGGVGKTTVCCQLAMFLAMTPKSGSAGLRDEDAAAAATASTAPASYPRVGIIDADLCGPSVARVCGAEGVPVMQAAGGGGAGWRPVRVRLGSAATSVVVAATAAAGHSHDDEAAIARKSANQHQQKEPSPDAAASSGSGGGGDGTQPSASSPLATERPAPVPIIDADDDDSAPSIRLMSMASLLNSASDAVVWRGPRKDAMIKQFITGVEWGELDYLLIDTPPGTSDEHLTLCELLAPLSPAGAVVVTTPQSISTDDVRKELHFLAKLKVRCLGIVENMSGFVCPHCSTRTNIFATGGGEKLAAQYETNFLGRIPIDPVLSHAEDLGVAIWNMRQKQGQQAPASAKALEGVVTCLKAQLARVDLASAAVAS